jgi:hypothetical protein
MSEYLRYEATEVVTRIDRADIHGITYHASACLDCGALVWDTHRHDQFHDSQGVTLPAPAPLTPRIR